VLALAITRAAYVDVRLQPTAEPDAFERLAHSLPAARAVAFVTGSTTSCNRPAETSTSTGSCANARSRQGVAATETRIVMRSTDPTRWQI
jgi:hypothetical protein